MDPQNYNAAKGLSAKTFDPKILLQQKPGRVDPWARQSVPAIPARLGLKREGEEDH